MDAEWQGIIDRYWGWVGGDRGDEMRLRWRAEHGDRDAKVELGRIIARRKVEEERRTKLGGEPDPIGVPEEPPKPPTLRPGELCPGMGKFAVKRTDGVWVCPACHEPVETGCRPSQARVKS